VLHFDAISLSRAAKLQCVYDRFNHVLSSHDYVVIPESDNPPSLCAQHRTSAHVSGRTIVLAAINFDDETMLRAGEINCEWRYWVLTSEFATRHTPIAQQVPEQTLGRRGVAAQIAGMSDRHGFMLVIRQ